MKKRKWHKITAALASVAVILSSPGITDLVKGSSTEFVDMEPISEETITASENEENISRATEDFSETTEEPEENFANETAAEEGSENNEADSVDCVEDFSCEDTSDTENVSPEPASAVTVLQKADETENTELTQGEAHKAKITSSVPAGQEAAKVRLYLTDAQNENPVTDLKITLSSGESTQEIIKDPVQLPEALNQNEPLTVTPVTEYQLDEDGDYVFDEDGNYQISAYYLEYEVPAGGSTAFEASFVYTTDAEEYDFQAKLRARMFHEPEETGEEISLNEEESRLTLIWNSQAEQETEDDALVEMEELAAEDVGEAGEKIVYFAAPTEWTGTYPGYQMKVWIKVGTEAQSEGFLLNMTDLNESYHDMKVYSVTFTEQHLPYHGLGTLYFQAFVNDKWNAEVKATDNYWLDQSVFLGKLYDSKTSTWVNYTPFNPNDHTSFAGKTMYFENNTEEPLNAVNAVFYEKDTEGNLQQVGEPVPMQVIQNGFSVTIPDKECSYVQFQDTSGNVLGDTYSNFYGQGAGEEGVESVLFAVGSMDCYKYDVTPEDSTWGVLGERTVYYDATLSKMSYARSGGRNGGKGIPYDSNSKVYYYATKSDGTSVHGVMQAVAGKDNNLWSTSLSEVYTKIRFAGYAVENATPSENGDETKPENIPWNMKNPCYFGDDSDDVIYKGGNRGGYWGEKDSVRDAESGKENSTVVDVPAGTFTRDSNTMYVDTTLYDYYSDYELNGQNRDNYEKVEIASHRIYQPFRQFNQALSTYYEKNNVTYPLYWGNFQNFNGSHYSEIAGTLNLYGYSENEKNKFFYENNSMWDSNGQKIEQGGQNATQGLSGAQLAKGSLTLAGGGAIAPFFDEDFLKGNNSKHTVLGNVYHNVTFPFIKKELPSSAEPSKSGKVDYWCFDSADQSNSNRNLRLKYDSSNGYFLQSTNEVVRGQTVESGHPATADGNYFPLNSSSESGDACKLNYGFGQKLQFKFRLTQNGTVTTTNSEEVPIEFNFSGDDDVWVFIDDQLVLDVGGDHDVVSGRINFRDKNAWVSKVKNQSGGGYTDDKTSDFPASLKNDSDFYKKEHTLTMFYMERGLWESNMKVTFNFPDENQLQVEKQVDTTDVNDLFKKLFEKADLFDFTIKNLATHYGTKAASATTTEPVEISTREYDVAPANSSNVFKKEGSDSVHWYAKEQDPESTYRSQRYGVLTLNSPVDISNMQYLEFKFYYDYDDTPSLSNMYLQLVDSSEKVAGCLVKDKDKYKDKGTLSGRTYGTVSVASKQWITVKLDLSKLLWSDGFSKQNLKKIRFGYNYPRDIYLKDFIFRPMAELTASTGFVTKQYDIADYGSAKSGNLENPKGAVYTSSAKSGAYAIEDDGSFVLRDKETITFKDQFRRGSYIYLKEEVDPNLFDTTWTMFENGQAVNSMGTGNTVTNGSVSSLDKVTGLSVNDGRTENKVSIDAEGKNPQENNKYNGNRPKKQSSENTSEKVPEDTFVFRSYAAPDDTTTLTKLKAVFYNKVKTGSLKLTKSPAYSPADDSLNGTYTFNITFTNVGGAGLEKEPIVQTVQLNLNETKEITGIPIGTFFTIEEITPDDGSTLDSISLKLNEVGVPQKVGTTVLQGYIKPANTTGEESQAEVVFKNTKKPKVNLSVEKLWKTAADKNYTGKLPDKIYVQLQRRSSDTATWEAVEYNNRSYTELTYNIYTNEWKTSFKDLDKYVDYTLEDRVQYQYRIVEVKLTKDTAGKVTEVTPVENGGCIEFAKAGMFKVSYNYVNPNSDSGISIGEDNNGSAIITNTYQPSKTSIKILKIKAGTSVENPEKLAGAEFKLEKLTAGGTITVQTVTTGDGKENGELGSTSFKDLEDGTYRITETKAPEGYNLLKSPITVVINRIGNSITVDGTDVFDKISDNTITIQVANQAKFQLPATGSWSRLILGFTGAIIAGTAVIMYLLLQKRRKEGKTS